MILIMENSHFWVVQDTDWAIISLHSRRAYLLFKKDKKGIYRYFNKEFLGLEEIIDYIEGL